MIRNYYSFVSFFLHTIFKTGHLLWILIFNLKTYSPVISANWTVFKSSDYEIQCSTAQWVNVLVDIFRLVKHV